MNKAQDHYDQQLVAIYSWMSGNPEAAIARNHDLFCQFAIDSLPRGLAVDLGAGSGFQSIPLAELGFSVVAIDFCDALLSELHDRAKHLSIPWILSDRWSFSASSYQKLRLDRNWLCDRLPEIGLQILQNEMINGMVCIIANKF